MMIRSLMLVFSFLFLAACNNDSPDQPIADLLVLGADIYTVNKAQPRAQALAIKDGVILDVVRPLSSFLELSIAQLTRTII